MELVTLTDLEGRSAKVELFSQAREGQRVIRLEDGQALSLPEDSLVKQQSGDYYLLLKLSELEVSANEPEASSAVSDVEREADEAVIPVAEEQAVVRKRQVDKAKVRVAKRVLEEEQTVDEPLFSEEVQVERVRINRVVDAPEPIRYEGDTTIIPLYEEVLVVEKRLMLSEEVHVSKQRTERREPQSVTLRREEVSVERVKSEEGVMEGDDETV